jgi:hypothetical protein
MDCSPIFQTGLIKRHDVLDGTYRLDVVARRKNITAARAQDAEVVDHFLPDLLDRAEGQRLLVIHATVQNHAITKIAL